MRLIIALAVVPIAVTSSVTLGACETQPLDVRPPGGVDGGGNTAIPAPMPIAVATTAIFDDGLRRNLAASVGPEWQTASALDLVFEGLSISAGYGVDMVWLGTGFDVVDSDRTLWVGGRREDASVPGRNPRALRTAEQMWSALAGVPETVELKGVTRRTPDGRVACSRDVRVGEGLYAQCALTGLQYLGAGESQQ